MPTLNANDGKWSIKIESESQLSIFDSVFFSLMRSIYDLHSQASIIKISFKNTNKHLVIDFAGNRCWKIKIYTQDANSEVSYLIPGGDKWIRSFVLSYITPFTNSLMSLNADKKLIDLDVKPI